MAQARWLVNVDWNDDGGFSGDGEDVSADVIDLTLECFRDMLSGHVEAARLELKLRNDDHQYSPPNANSPLYGNLKPGRKVWVRSAYPYDGFTSSAGGTRLTSHTPDLDSGFTWTENTQGFRTVSAGGGVETDSVRGNGDCAATLDFGDSDVSFGCDFIRGADTSSHGGLCLRYADASNYLYARVTGAAVEVRKVEAGADTRVATKAHAWSAGARKFLQVTLHGDSIRVFVNDEEVVDATSSFNSAATRHGLFCDDQADHVWRGFGGWVSLFHGVIDAIHPRPRLGAQYCYVRALDDVERLTSVTMYTYAASQFPQTSDEILDDMLDHAAAAPNRRRMDTGATLVPKLWSPPIWGVRGVDEIYRLQDEEDGLVYVDGHGYWRLESRSHRATPPHTSSRVTIEDTGDGGNPYFSELVWDDGVNNIENVVFMRIRDASYQGFRTAWTLKEKPFFDAHETKDFLAESADYDMLVGQLRPRKNSDYKANTRENEKGTDISGQLRVTHPSARAFRGKGTLIRVTFGATPGYLTLLKLRTLNAYLFDDPLLVRAEDAASKREYGQRVKSIDARWTREADVAQATIESRLARKKRPKSVLNVVLFNGSRPNMMTILQRGFSDRVTLSYANMGINEDFYVEGRKISVSEGWTMVACELLLQGV